MDETSCKEFFKAFKNNRRNAKADDYINFMLESRDCDEYLDFSQHRNKLICHLGYDSIQNIKMNEATELDKRKMDIWLSTWGNSIHEKFKYSKFINSN